jgi:hypothetical protein
MAGQCLTYASSASKTVNVAFWSGVMLAAWKAGNNCSASKRLACACDSQMSMMCSPAASEPAILTRSPSVASDGLSSAVTVRCSFGRPRPDHPGSPLSGHNRDLLGQPGFADPGLTAEEYESAVPGQCQVHSLHTALQFALPADQEGDASLHSTFRHNHSVVIRNHMPAGAATWSRLTIWSGGSGSAQLCVP